jgi:myo-inositol 2-dehydrogenase / D-chiro-inositol 1-dehydrogenase
MAFNIVSFYSTNQLYKMEEKSKPLDRRIFLKNAASIAAVSALGSSLLFKSCGSDKSKVVVPTFLDQAPDGKVLKVGLVGCGGRGTGAIFNFLDSGPGIEITALGDVFKDKLDRCRNQLKEQKSIEIADEKCFLGFDAYEKVIEAGVDVVVLATPPFFRPQHFDACVRARKHVFMEKPLAVDPVGARSIMASGKMAEAAGLKVGCGTQRHHQRDYLTILEHIKAGAIGEITAANCYWNQGQLWYNTPVPGRTQMENMLRDWVNWNWLSGDHIVEQHMHNIDVINWFSGKLPTKAVGFGSRQRRPTGDQYDNFSIDFVYDDGMHMHSMCRQINGCTNNVSEWITGTKGRTNCNNRIVDLNGNTIFEFAYAQDGHNVEGKPAGVVNVSPYDQEIIDLVAAIRNNTPFNEVELCAQSTMVAIMGRISAYTGKEVTYEEMMNSNLKLGPDKLEMGDVDIKAVIPVPGVV